MNRDQFQLGTQYAKKILRMQALLDLKKIEETQRTLQTVNEQRLNEMEQSLMNLRLQRQAAVNYLQNQRRKSEYIIGHTEKIAQLLDNPF